MCTQHFSKAKEAKTIILYFAIITLSIISGLSGFNSVQNIGLVISDIFIKIFKCISLPMITLSIIVTISHCNSDDQMKRIWQKTLFYTVSTTIVAASVALALFWLIAPPSISASEPNLAISNNTNLENKYLAYLMNTIPENIFAPFLEHQVLGAIIISMLVGVAIKFIPENDSRIIISNFFKGAHGIFLVVTSWVVKLLPIALFGFITTTVVQLKNGLNVSGLGEYLTVIVLANIIQGLVILPIFLHINNIKPFATLKGMLPALSVGFFSKSSAGTLPITIETAESNLNIQPKISRFVLPLCTSINMNGCAAFIFTTVIYLMQNNGVEVTFATMLLWVFIATIAAIGNAGVPMGCFFLSASLLTSMDIPITLLGLILPFYSVIDMLETSLNIWSDSCIAKVIDKQTKAIDITNELL